MTDNSYPFYVWSGLLTEEHQKNMGNAIWLYLLFVNMTTEEKDGTGFVLGGAAVTYKRIHERLGLSRDTYFRWMKILRDEGYVNVTQTLHGNSIEINNSKRRKNPTDKPIEINQKDKPYTQAFLEFWFRYPRKVGKIEAFNSYKRCGVGNDILIPAIEKQEGSDKWKRGFIPNPATWLNQGRWDDEIYDIPCENDETANWLKERAEKRRSEHAINVS